MAKSRLRKTKMPGSLDANGKAPVAYLTKAQGKAKVAEDRAARLQARTARRERKAAIRKKGNGVKRNDNSIRRNERHDRYAAAKDWNKPAPAGLNGILAVPRMSKYKSHYEIIDNPDKKDKKLEIEVCLPRSHLGRLS